jgi:hypothetical protein
MSDAPPANRLSIAHLLLWTATTAAALAFANRVQEMRIDYLGGYDAFPAAYQRLRWIEDMLWYAVAPAYGAAIAATLLAVWHWSLRRGGFPSQPGHWVAVMLGVGASRVAGAYITSGILPEDMFIELGVLILGVVLACLAAASTKGPRRWRTALLMNAGGHAALADAVVAGRAAGSPASLRTLILLPALAIFAAMAAALLASLIDLVSRERFDLFHWIGVGSLWMIVVHPIVAIGLERLLLG